MTTTEATAASFIFLFECIKNIVLFDYYSTFWGHTLTIQKKNKIPFPDVNSGKERAQRKTFFFVHPDL
jgi:hypothetical protein